MTVYTILADGFEEVEALAVVDVLMRAGIEVKTISIMEHKIVEGAHKIGVRADKLFFETDFNLCDMIFLPGGMPGTIHLGNHEGLKKKLQEFADRGKYLAAICAAPSVLGKMGLLDGKKAIAFPGFEDKLEGAVITNERVVKDGKIFTAKGMGTALDLGLAIVAEFMGENMAAELAKSIQYK